MAQGVEIQELLAELPPPQRLAVAYAPAKARAAWTALLVLDRRLMRAALGTSEPLVGQLRLAWWRDRFRTPCAQWPEGEPLLAALAPFDAERPALEALVDGWEALVGGEPKQAAIDDLVAARAQAMTALAAVLGCASGGEAIVAAGRRWAQDDLAALFPGVAAPASAPAERLPRAMRPLLVLANLPPSLQGHGLGALLRIVRLGLLGR